MAKVITQIYGCEKIKDAQIAAALGVDHIGCGYGEIPHLPNQKNCAQAKEFFDALPDNVVKVGLTIATDVDEIINDLTLYEPDVFHLSGDIRDISPEGVQRIRDAFPNLKIMQAIPVYSGIPVEEQWPVILELVRAYEATTDFFLIDTKDPDSTIGIGATGITHDREIDRRIIESTDVKCIIAGGLDASNDAEAIRQTHPYGVDSCTRTTYPKFLQEITGRVKDPVKIWECVEAARNA
jgi:phosphoribosylanthranilate isomerase